MSNVDVLMTEKERVAWVKVPPCDDAGVWFTDGDGKISAIEVLDNGLFIGAERPRPDADERPCKHGAYDAAILSQENARDLWPIIKHFGETGRLEPPPPSTPPQHRSPPSE